MEKLSPIEMLYDIIYDIKKGQNLAFKNAKSHNNFSINF
jgi:hypothetical protein